MFAAVTTSSSNSSAIVNAGLAARTVNAFSNRSNAMKNIVTTIVKTALTAALATAALALGTGALVPQAASAQGLVKYVRAEPNGGVTGPYGGVTGPYRLGIQSAAGFSANVESEIEFAIGTNGMDHNAYVADADGNYLFAFAQNGDITTLDGYTLTTGGEVKDAKGRPINQLNPSFNITRTPGGYELGWDKANGTRSVRTPAGQLFTIEDMPRHLCPSGLYYD